VLSVQPWVRTVPETPAPGRVEEALGLVMAHALPLDARRQGAVLAFLLDPGTTPASVERTAARFNMSTRWVRYLSYTARTFARTVPPPVTVLEAMRRVGRGGIRTGGEITASLFTSGLTVGQVPVRSLLQIGDLFGVTAAQTTRLVATGAGGSARQVHPDVVVVPGQDYLPLRSYLDHLHLVLRHQIAVPLPTYASVAKLTTPPRTGKAVAPRASRAAMTALVGHDRRLQLHELESAGNTGVRRGQRQWVWRAWDRRRQHHGVSIRLAQRLLVVRPHTGEQLHSALCGAVANLPPSQRYDASVPPLPVLVAWLEDVARQGSGLELQPKGWSWEIPMPPVDALLIGCCRERGGPVDSVTLREVLQDHGYTAAASGSAVQLPGATASGADDI